MIKTNGKLVPLGSIALLIVAACASSLSSGGTNPGTVSSAQYYDGDYTGSADGYRDTIEVWLQIYHGSVCAVEILYDNEDLTVGGFAMEELLEQVLDTNSSDLDVIAGATVSSQGFLAAVNEALDKAKKRN
ncbi:FMN-binding protein [Breznakiellaceae bacterium SP9]